MSPKFPSFADLAVVATKLKAVGKDAKLKRCLDQASRANSCLGDLKQARDCCEVLRGMVDRPKAGDTHLHLTIERALLANGISLYTRATSTSGQKDERGSIQVERGSLTKDQWDDHRLIVDVRNQAISHVYDARSIGQHSWHKTSIFAVELSPRQWRPVAASNQTSFNRSAYDALTRAVPIAYEVIKEKFFKRMRAVLKELAETAKQEMLEDSRFDPVERFGSDEAVKAFLELEKPGVGVMWSRQ